MESTSGHAMRILFVCIGNICRSPMAEAMAREIGGDGVHAESAGIAAFDGNLASANSITAAKERGFDVGEHRARYVGNVDLGSFDRVVALDPGVAVELLNRFDVPRAKLVELDVEDPYGDSLDAYRACATEIETAVRELLSRPSQGDR